MSNKIVAKLNEPIELEPTTEDEKSDEEISLGYGDSLLNPVSTAIPKRRGPKPNPETIAKQMKVERKLPSVPGKDISYTELLKWLKLLTPEMWAHVMVYLYREDPITMRQLSDPNNKNYIDVYSSVWTDEEFRAKHGGGSYCFRVVDTDQTRGANIIECRYKIPINECMPIIDYKELVWEDKRNQSYIRLLKSKGIVNDKGEQVSTQANANLPVLERMVTELFGMVKNMSQQQRSNVEKDPENAAMLKAIEVAASGGMKSMEMLMERFKSDSPEKMLGLVTTIVNALKGANSGDNATSDRLLAMMQKNFDTQLEMVKLMYQTKNEAKEEKDPLDSLTKVLDIADRLKGGSGGGKWYEKVLDHGLPILGQLITPALNIYMMNQAMKAKQMGVDLQVPVQQPTPSPMQTTNPMGQPPMGLPPGTEQHMSMIQQLTTNPMALTIIANAIVNGTSGDTVADSVVNLYGMPLYKGVAREGVDKIVEVMKTIPQFWMQVEPVVGEEGVRKWVQEFIDYEKMSGDEDTLNGTTLDLGGN